MIALNRKSKCDRICENRALRTPDENSVFVIIRQIWVWSITRENLEAIAYIVSEKQDLEPSPLRYFRITRFQENERYFRGYV